LPPSLYEQGGNGLEKNEAEALEWYGKAVGWNEVVEQQMKAAQQGDAEAQTAAGYTYRKFGVPLAYEQPYLGWLDGGIPDQPTTRK
jgi:TPR repeat protein